MNLLKCFLFLALIAAASATSRRYKLSREGRCGFFCGLTTRRYIRPSNNGRCLGVFGFLASGLSAKVDGVIGSLFGTYSNIGVATSIDVATETCLNLSKGIALIINKWIDGLGLIFENLVMGISKLLFCVLKNPWESGNFIDRWFSFKRSKAPAVCGNNFGVKWGWFRYSRGWSWDEVVRSYNLINIRVRLEKLLRSKLNVSIGSLKGTPKVIVDAILGLIDLYERDFETWDRKDYVEVTKYLIKCSAAVASAYKADAGVAVVDEYNEYLKKVIYKEYKVDIVEVTTVVKVDIQECDTRDLNGVYKVEESIQKEKEEKSSAGSDGDEQKTNEENNGGGGNGGGGNGKTTKTVKKTEWETVYDDEGNIVSSTKPEGEEDY